MTHAATTAIDALGALHGLDAVQRAALAALIDALASDEHAPTAVREPERAVDVHIADSLAALDVAQLRSAASVADIGAGAGFPGLPLAIALPAARVALVESQSRKCRFLRQVVASAGVSNAHVVEARVEEWADGTGAQDVVLARARAPQPVVLEYAAPILKLGGMLIDWRGRRDADEEAEAVAAAAELGMELAEVRGVQPYATARDHHLHLYLKVRDTPQRFPRRPGAARKKPLGHAGRRAPTGAAGSVP